MYVPYQYSQQCVSKKIIPLKLESLTIYFHLFLNLFKPVNALYNNLLSIIGDAKPKWVYAKAVAIRPRGVRCKYPC